MSERIDEGAASERTLARLRAVRAGLLRLHKVLLDAEREDYESAHGRVSPGELLRLAIGGRQFAWLRALSELIVEIDEALAAKTPATEADAEALVAQARELLRPSEDGDEFARMYFAALQRDPAAVMAHREATRLLSAGE